MAEKSTNREMISEELEQRLDLVTKRHDEGVQKARNYIVSEKQVRSDSSRSGKLLLRMVPQNLELHIALGSQVMVKQSQ